MQWVDPVVPICQYQTLRWCARTCARSSRRVAGAHLPVKADSTGHRQTARVRRERPDDTPTFVPNVDKASPLTTGTCTRTRDAGAVEKPHSQLCGRRM